MDTGLTLDELIKMRKDLRDGLAELRQQVSRQEGAVLLIDEQIKAAEAKQPTEPETIEDEAT